MWGRGIRGARADGTYHGTIFEGKVVRQFVRQIGSDFIIPAERTIVWWCSGKDNVRAQLQRKGGVNNRPREPYRKRTDLVLPFLAVFADAARLSGFHSHSISHLEMLHTGSN